MSSASSASSVAKGALWNYAAQIGTVLAQLVYAGLTSRLLDPHTFGVFAAALTSTALINLLALAGLPQIIGRMQALEPRRMAGLLAYAGTVGAAAALVLLATADLWALAWGIPDAAPLVRVLAITSFLTPLVAVSNGLQLRLGHFRRLATVTVTGNAVGMAVGLVVVFVARTGVALTVSQIVSQTIIAGIVLATSRAAFAGRPDIRATLNDVRYSARTLVSGLLTYTAGTVGKLVASQGFGTAPLGNWNRAEAITTTPFFQLGSAITQAVYPEFRHDIADRNRTARVWTDMLALMGWVTVPLGVILAVIAPTAVHILLGPGWGQAADFAQILAIIGGLQPVVFLIVSGFEALGRFGWIWSGYILALIANVGGAIAALLAGSIMPIFVGTLVSFALMHALHITLAARDHLVEPRRLLRQYLEIVGGALVVAAVMLFLVNAVAVWNFSPFALIAGLVVIIAALPAAWRYRQVLPPFRIALRYGLVPARFAPRTKDDATVGGIPTAK